MGRYKSVVIINISAFLLMVGVGMIVALLPQRIMNLSNSVSSVGYLASAFALPYALFQIPIGNLSDKYGFKPFLVGGYFLCSLTGLLYYFSNSSNLIFLSRMLQGIGEVPIWAVAPALLSIQHPDQKGKFMGIYNASLHCGLTLGSFVGILFNRIWHGNEVFLLFAGLCFLGGVLIALFVKVPQQGASTKVSNINHRGVLFLLNNLTNRVVLAGIMLYGAGYGIFITIIPAFLISAKNSTQTVVGVFFMLFYIAVSLSQLITGPVSDRKGRKPAMVWGFIMATIGMLTFWKLHQAWFIGLLTLSAVGLGMFCVSAMAFLNESVPRNLKGTVSGAFYFSWGTGYFFGPLLLGKLGDSNQLEMGFLFLTGLFVLELIALSVVMKEKSKLIKIHLN